MIVCDRYCGICQPFADYCCAFFSYSDPARSWHGIDASIWWTGGRICSWFTLEIRVGCVRCGDSGNTHIMDATSCLSKGARNDFLNPESDVLGAGYQITQSKIALGSGGFFGKGFLMGSQSQLNYLPEKQTDFVFTMIGEEFGFAGNVFILFIYLLLTISIMWISFRVQSRFAQLTCIGIAMTVFFYMFVNVAMVTGLLPVVGAPLPFISYGGTSMLTLFVAFGIVASAIVHDRRET